MTAARPKILVVDDEPFNVDFLQQELDDLGYDTVTAADGGEALEQVRATAPDLVLLDIMMPVMDGFAVLQHLKADPATRDIPVVIISAMNDIGSIVKGILRGADDYLPKPFEPVLLQARIRTGIDRKLQRDRELEYLRQVERLTAVAESVQASAYDEATLAPVASRDDALGNLARVFRKMAQEVVAREQRLKQQLHQLQLDIEEHRASAGDTAAVYVPMDRRQALAHGDHLPEAAQGTALFADISGFTPLTESFARELGMQRGAEEVTRQVNRVHAVLIDCVHRYGGSATGFGGDAITCWFEDDDGLRADRLRIGDPGCDAAIREHHCARGHGRVDRRQGRDRAGRSPPPAGRRSADPGVRRSGRTHCSTCWRRPNIMQSAAKSSSRARWPRRSVNAWRFPPGAEIAPSPASTRSTPRSNLRHGPRSRRAQFATINPARGFRLRSTRK